MEEKIAKSDNNKGKLTLFRSIMLALVPAIIILIYIYTYFVGSRYISTDDAYIKIGISSVSPQVSGVVSEVKAQNTQAVKKGEVILTIDQDPFQINVEAAEANLVSAINQIHNLKAGYNSKLAGLESARADLEYYQKQYDRAKGLRNANAVPQSALDEAKRYLENAVQKVNDIEETINQHLASLDGNIELPIEKHAAYLKAKAELDKAKLDLSYTIISAPFDGYVANLYAKAGSFASTGTPLFSVIDYNDIWVEANFKETELTNIKPGQKATITIDSFPGNELSAKVVGITRAAGSEFSILPAQNSSGNWVKVTQRIVVRLALDNSQDLPLASGMSVIVTVDIKGT